MASLRTRPWPPSIARSRGPKTSMLIINTRPKQMPMINACTANAAARSISSAPNARAIDEATPPPMAPPDIVIIKMTNGNTRAIAASGSTPNRPM